MDSIAITIGTFPNFRHLNPTPKKNDGRLNLKTSEGGSSYATLPPQTNQKHYDESNDLLLNWSPRSGAKARAAERARLAALDAMAGPGLNEIISRAKADGSPPEAILMECFKVTQAQLASSDRQGALARDAAAASGVRAGDAPPTAKPADPQAHLRTLVINAHKQCRPPGAPANGAH